MTPWRRVLCPVRSDARVELQTGVAYAWVNFMPFAARASMFGVWWS